MVQEVAWPAVAPVVLSPHPDDAVLSLWHVLTQPGDVRVLSVFTARPAPGAVGWWDRLTGAENPVVRWRERWAEDREALASAGRTAERLDLAPGQYSAIRSQPDDLLEKLDGLVPVGDVIYAPAALDGHPSHQAVRDAALELSRRGARVLLYADVPHCIAFGWPAWVTGAEPHSHLRPEAHWEHHLEQAGLSPPRLSPDVRVLDDAAHRAKLEAVRAYRSQLAALEAQFGALLGGPALRYEVVWPLPGA